MKSNPSYYLLLKKHLLDFTHKTAQHGARYLLVKLATSHHLNIELLGNNAQFIEHHLSIYQKFSPTDATLGAFHYTAKYKQQGKVLIIHSYFDHCGNLLLSQVRHEGANQTIIKVTKKDSILLSDIAQCYLEDNLKTLMSALFSNTQKLNEERKQLLLNLEEKSRLGVTTRDYLGLLRQTIDQLSTHLNLLIDSRNEHLVVEQLQRQYTHLNQKSNKPPEKKQQKPSVSVDEQEDMSSSCSSSSAAAVVPVQKEKFILETRLAEIIKLPFVERYEEQRSILTKVLNSFGNDQFDEIISLINKLEQLEDERRKIIVSLSRTGDLVTLKKLLQKQDIFLIPFMLTNAAFHQHYEVFSYLYPFNKFVNKIFIPPLFSITGKRIPLVSFLAIAFENDDLVFFRELLTVYKVEPVSEAVCLLMTSLEQNRSDFAEAFLAAGANPNGITSRSEMMEVIDGKLVSLENDPLKEMSKLKRNPLVYAVSKRKKEDVALLLKHKAKTNIAQNNKFNAFNMAVMSENAVVDKEIVLLVMAAGGHQIDERTLHTGTTGLYYACQYQCAPSVQVLLELGANPVAPHVCKIRTKSGDSTIHDTPLAKAVTKKNVPIVTMILESKSPFLTYREIQRALIMAVNTARENPCIPILETHYRRLAHTEALKQYKEENFPQVINLYKQIARYNPTPAEEHSYCYCLGSAHFKMKDYAKAEEMLNHSLQLRKRLLSGVRIVERPGLESLIEKVQVKINEVKMAQEKVLALSKSAF